MAIWNVKVMKCDGVGGYDVVAEGDEGMEAGMVTVWWMPTPRGREQEKEVGTRVVSLPPPCGLVGGRRRGPLRYFFSVRGVDVVHGP